MLTVTRTVDGSSGIKSLHVRDIAFLEYDRKEDRVLVHTVDDVFYVVGTLKYWTIAFNASGYSFKQVDRNNVVNLDRVTALDPTYKHAYFEEPVSQESKHCTIAWSRYKEVEEALGVKLINTKLAIN